MSVFFRRLLPLLLGLILLLAPMGCSETGNAGQTPTPPVSQSLPPEDTDSPAPATPAVSTPEPTVSPDPTTSPDPVISPDPEPSYPVYEFGTPLAQSEVVDDSYFDTAVFLGDSRTEGLQLFGGLHRGDYYWARGMTVFRVDDPNFAVFQVDDEALTMIGALSKKEYSAVYIMVGVNELGYDYTSYETGLAAFIDKVLEAQPNAVIYLQTLPPVNEDVAKASGLASYINNTRINRFNEIIVQTAAEKGVVLLDTAETYRDENGVLPAELASDGCHFVFGGYARWVDYLRCHVMDADTYHYNRGLHAAQPPAEDAPAPQTTEEVGEV